MADSAHLLLRSNLKQLRLPAILAEFDQLAREAANANEDYAQYLLRLTEVEVAARAANAVQARIRQAGFPVHKDFDTFDFTAVPALSKPKMLELARGEWIEQRANACLIGSPGTGKTHCAVALGLAACRQGKRVRFYTAAALVTRLEEAQKQYQLDRLLSQLDRTDLLICDELPVVQPGRGRAAVPGVRRPLRAAQPAGHQQPGLQRLGTSLPGRADDGGAVGPADAPLPHLRDEWRKLPLPRVDEEQEGQEGRQ
jgi:DNA replication protein DnaC